jgi:Flp pilus assembly protein TadD
MTTLGAVLMRAGEQEEAHEWFRRAQGLATDEATSMTYLRYLQAMNQWHLGNLETAKEFFILANQLADAELASSPEWNRELTICLLRDEANSLINSLGD